MLTKSTEYAIRALVYVQLQNWKEMRPGVPEIALEIEAPAAFTAKILHILSSRSILESMKGRGGGFFFADNQSDLSLYQVIMVMEGDKLFTKCGFGLKNCSDANPCPLHDRYAILRDDLLKMAHSETIGSLARKINSGQAVLNRAIPAGLVI
ncbi:MAG: Rrf2 family transcriptional regulator [Bacteroidales bacterium]|nr:Rrf2 family transcriptional regulator [Bacteroidales bacterium]